MGRIYNVYVSNEDKVRVYKYRSSALQFAKRRIKKLEHEPDICIDIYEIEELPKFCKSLIKRFATNNNPLSPTHHG